jgi:predicted nuclease with TOPRIM domain
VAIEQDNRIEIELLKKDITTMAALLEKFDTTIDKMQEIASSLSKMVSLQEQRLETQEKITREVQELLEMRRQEHNNNIKDVYNRINTVNKELTDKIEDTEKTILQEIQKLRTELSKDKEGIGDRLGKIEMWKYGLGVVIIVLAWLAGQTDILSKLVK